MQDEDLLAVVNNIFVVVWTVRVGEVTLHVFFLVEPLAGHVDLSTAVDEEQTSEVSRVLEFI